MNLTALLPLKRHSERIPGKNFRAIAGKPLFRWVLETLLAAPEVGRVVINTDAREELDSLGVVDGGPIQIRDRPREIRGDLVSMNRIIEDDLANVEGEEFLQTHATNPLLQPSTISKAVAALAANADADSLFTVTPRYARFYWEDSRPVNHDPQELQRTQDLPPLFEENSNLYLFSRDSFARTRARIGGRPMMFPMQATESVDIDDDGSWMLAQRLLEVKTRGSS